MVDTDCEETLNKKYKRSNRLQQTLGIRKPVAKRFLLFIFGDNFIELVADKTKRKFQVFVKSKVNEKMYIKFREQWSDIFDVYKIM